MSRFKTYQIGQIAEVQTGPFGSQLHMSDYVLDGTPIITVEHFGENRIIHRNLPLVSNEDKTRLIKYTLREGDVVFSRVGSVDRRVYVSANENGWMFSGRCLRVRVNEKIVNGKYISYYFGLESFKEYIRVNAVGATMPSINTQILSEAEVTLPPLSEQQAIAEVLSSLDDKIDLLHRNNKTLEEMAEVLFRQWFLQEGSDQWLQSTLKDEIVLIGGGTPKTSVAEYWDGDIPWLSGGDIANAHRGFVTKSEKYITEEGLNNSSAKLLPEMSTVITARGTVGKYCLTSKPMVFSQSNYGILPKITGTPCYTYLLTAYCVDELLAASYGSVFDTITTRTFEGVKINIPREDEILQFEDKARSLFQKILLNTLEIDNLVTLRDLILPKLMSGSIIVKSNSI